MGATHLWWGNLTVCDGLMLEQGTHVFDLLRYLILEFTYVQAFSVKDVFAGVADFEECTNCNLSFENGVIGNFTSTCVSNTLNGFSSELVGGNFHLNLNLDYWLHGHIDAAPIEFNGTESGLLTDWTFCESG